MDMRTRSQGTTVVLDIPRCNWPNAGCTVLAKWTAVEIGPTPGGDATVPVEATYQVCGRHARKARSHHYEIQPLPKQ